MIFTRYSPTTTIEHDLLAHSGQEVELIRPITRNEADICDVGPMFAIRFADGYENHAFIDELDPPPATEWAYDQGQDCWINTKEEEPRDTILMLGVTVMEQGNSGDYSGPAALKLLEAGVIYYSPDELDGEPTRFYHVDPEFCDKHGEDVDRIFAALDTIAGEEAH